MIISVNDAGVQHFYGFSHSVGSELQKGCKCLFGGVICFLETHQSHEYT